MSVRGIVQLYVDEVVVDFWQEKVLKLILVIAN